MPNPSRTSAVALGLAALLSPLSTLAATQVVTSIKPVELLVKAVAPEDVEVTSLVPSGSSPHNYTMRPSQRRALENADVIFWVGPEMETFLSRLLGGEEFSQRTVSLMHGDEVPAAEAVDAHHHDHHDDHNDAHSHGHGDGEDPHIWLDPALALDMAQDIHRALSQLEGADTEALDANLARFETSLHEAEDNIRHRLEPLANISLFAYHDAFTRYAGHFDLKLEGVLTLNPELSPGARHIAEVQDKLRAANQPCLLTEPQFNRQWWRSITNGLDITFSTWDPLATDVESDRNGYVNFLQGIADNALSCLPEKTR
ncbi:zinc ABC transporter substrate-binding protein [Marinobacter sp. M-5]|uniref:zinc ABC transporter substrate-binding protein n=1 Tax=Marinobacter sp. M-5 TaxID=3081089 RepID=UPI00293C6F75|nr:zinc ABC transporter substrate-binding protein [Marinobacter sp. M-5]MDV3503281.1 zinc ABC transporter substrate-binding protein [Marinobacter sp. M-5]